MYVIRFEDQEKWVCDIDRDGLLIATTQIEGYPIHPTVIAQNPERAGDRTLNAATYATEKLAQDMIDYYHTIELPEGKRHSSLVVEKYPG